MVSRGLFGPCLGAPSEPQGNVNRQDWDEVAPAAFVTKIVVCESGRDSGDCVGGSLVSGGSEKLEPLR